MSKRTVPSLSDRILDEATTWFVEFSEGHVTRTGREQFIAWLRTSPEHVRAYLQIMGHWQEADVLGKSRSHSADELVALARADRSVVQLDPTPRSEPDATSFSVAPSPLSRKPLLFPLQREFRKRPWLWHGLAASILLAALFISTWFYIQRNLYATHVGELRSITLPDGSTIELNARTQIRVAYHDHERDIDLLDGQAIFHVVKDQARPFIVHAGDTRVRAVGTQFDVYKKPTGDTTVSVVEGRVAVFTDPSIPPKESSVGRAPSAHEASGVQGEDSQVLLVAGDQLTVTGTAAEKSAAPDVAAATAWTRRQIVFRASPLTEVVAEFNRYNAQQLVITDPGIRTVRVSGVFSSTNPGSFLRGLNALGKFKIHETRDCVEISGE
jgi:ferric-dicitrate binding protein FerR (iron transport regulator)